ncbi:MAG: class I poly(R)-hydroxyalkanoic acid synthase [Alphaproteobacteria bacterium]|nr:class I poly(R)-hydroxyalkanoic acid synthase [Alphaproteobacteria bacterium]
MTETPSPEALQKEIGEFAEQSQRAVQSFWQRQLTEQAEGGFSLVDPSAVSKAFFDFGAKLMADPTKLAEAQMAFWQGQADLWQRMMQRAQGGEAEPLIEPERGDRRFKDQAWDDQLLFDYIKQSYLLSAAWMHGLVDKVDHQDPETHERVAFYTRQFISAMSPSNFALTNPAVLEKAKATGGQNLVEGLKHLLADLERGKGRLKISMVDEQAFEVGVNVAASEGQVIYQNELMQLVQYAPTTETAFKRPLLLVPPWINKFYILDLQPKNSFIKHAVDQGHTVFVVSWANPSKEHADKAFEDYLLEGPLEAMAAIEQATGEREINVLGFCIGGILVSALLGHLAAKGEGGRIKSATFLTSLFDFNDVGEARVFIDDEQIAQIERHIAEKGYLEGHHMADMFSMMRENDLIWSFVVNNYLMGREPMAFDLLYWNADSTRLPAAMLIFYLKTFYQQNLLREPGGLTLAGTPIDLTSVKTPTYLMAAKDDHIAPWKSCYPGTQLFAGPKKFVLAASGHIAGVVNPPGAKKYGHWTNAKLPKEADAWLDGAEWHDGSWWPDWYRWLARKAGKKVPARVVGEGKLKPIEPAPGSYVKVRVSE